MNVRFQKTARGEVAILSRRDYEALVARAAENEEDAGTARIVARGRREVTSGAPLLPKQVVDRMANGESPLRVLRGWRGMTQQQLAAATSISQSAISDIEKGRRTGTPATLRAISRELKVPVDLLFP